MLTSPGKGVAPDGVAAMPDGRGRGLASASRSGACRTSKAGFRRLHGRSRWAGLFWFTGAARRSRELNEQSDLRVDDGNEVLAGAAEPEFADGIKVDLGAVAGCLRTMMQLLWQPRSAARRPGSPPTWRSRGHRCPTATRTRSRGFREADRLRPSTRPRSTLRPKCRERLALRCSLPEIPIREVEPLLGLGRDSQREEERFQRIGIGRVEIPQEGPRRNRSPAHWTVVMPHRARLGTCGPASRPSPRSRARHR